MGGLLWDPLALAVLTCPEASRTCTVTVPSNDSKPAGGDNATQAPFANDAAFILQPASPPSCHTNSASAVTPQSALTPICGSGASLVNAWATAVIVATKCIALVRLPATRTRCIRSPLAHGATTAGRKAWPYCGNPLQNHTMKGSCMQSSGWHGLYPSLAASRPCPRRRPHRRPRAPSQTR